MSMSFFPGLPLPLPMGANFLRGIQRTANRSAHGQSNNNNLNTDVQCYMNVGAWTGGRTDVGIVSADEVALCSWRPTPDAGTHKYRGVRAKNQLDQNDRWTFAQTGMVANFINAAATASPGFQVLGGYVSPGGFKFTNANEALVFLPDSHLNLFREFACDSFAKKVHTGGGYFKQSLVPDLVAFLNFYQLWKAGACPAAKLIHVGDRVDIWHTQAICLEAHSYLHLTLLANWEKEHGKGSTTKIPYYHDATLTVLDRKQAEADIAANLGAKKGITKCEVTLSDWPNNVDVFDAMALFAEKNKLKDFRLSNSLKGRRVDYTSYQSIEAAIEAVYPEMTPALWGLFDVKVRGNHDMDLDHPYMHDRYKYPLDKKYLSFNPNCQDGRGWWPDHDEEDPSSTGHYGNVIGRNNCIWFEHGHVFDYYNHRKTFFREDIRAPEPDLKFRPAGPLPGGFMSTVGFVKDAFVWEMSQEATYKHTGKMFYVASGIVGDKVLEQYSYHRARRIFDKHAKGQNGESAVHLVVMGHTHVPHIEDFASWQSGWRFAAGAFAHP